MQSNRRKQSLRAVSARVLILGDRQVGKSATIVRFTTGRYIENYCHSTNDWLYKHPLGFDESENIFNSVELLEQKNVNFEGSPNGPNNIVERSTSHQMAKGSLAERVARDKVNDYNNHERQQLMAKLNWANAFVVIFSIDDAGSFDKAAKYLDMIANHLNSPKQEAASVSSKKFRSILSTQTNNIKENSILIGINQQPSSPLSSTSSSSNSPTASNTTNLSCNKAIPILLLGNKSDLASLGARQVSANDARLLAIKHHCLFAEISVKSQPCNQIELILADLLAQINPHELYTTRLHSPLSKFSEQDVILEQQQYQQQTRLARWTPATTSCAQAHNNVPPPASRSAAAPILANIVRTVLPQLLHHQPMIAQSSALGAGLATQAHSQPSYASLLVSKADTCTPLQRRKQQGAISAKPKLTSSWSIISDVTEIQIVKAVPVDKVTSCAQPLRATDAATKQASSTPLHTVRGQAHSQRLVNFKSSFRKASMAIVSGRALSGLTSSAAAARRKSPKGSVDQFEKAAFTPANVVVCGKRCSTSASEETHASLADDSDSSMCLNSLASSVEVPAASAIASGNRKISDTIPPPPAQTFPAAPPTTRQCARQPAGKVAANWLRNHIKLGSSGSIVSSRLASARASQDSESSETAAPASSGAGQAAVRADGELLGYSNSSSSSGNSNTNDRGASHSSVKFCIRPLFKYKTRRETVAFDRIPGAGACETMQKEAETGDQPLVEAATTAAAATQTADTFMSDSLGAIQTNANRGPSPESSPSLQKRNSDGNSQEISECRQSSDAMSSSSSLRHAAVPVAPATTSTNCYNANRCSYGRSDSLLSASCTSSLFIVYNPTDGVADADPIMAPAAPQHQRHQGRTPPTRTPSSAGSMSLCSSSNSSSLSSSVAGIGPANRQATTATTVQGLRQTNRKNSRSTLASHASISTGGSYEDTSEDEIRSTLHRHSKTDVCERPTNQRPSSPTLQQVVPLVPVVQMQKQMPMQAIASSQVISTGLQKQMAQAISRQPLSSHGGSGGKRFQLVRSVQSTLNSLTKSSANSSAEVAKKSFCNALFKCSAHPQQAIGQSLNVSSSFALFQVTKREPILQQRQQSVASDRVTMPGVVAGHCK